VRGRGRVFLHKKFRNKDGNKAQKLSGRSGRRESERGEKAFSNHKEYWEVKFFGLTREKTEAGRKILKGIKTKKKEDG